MQRPESRAEQRVPGSFPGTLILGDISAPCLIQNMCNRGFLIKYTRELPVGQVLWLNCELSPGESIDCKVEVRHVNAECLGARVIEISEAGKILCHQFVEEQRAAGLRGVTGDE